MNFAGRWWRRLLPGWSHFLRVELNAQLPVLPVLGRQLDETARQVEDSVVEVCGSFQSIADRARESVRNTASVLEGEGGSGVESIIETSRTTLSHLLERMERGGELSRRAVDQMQQVDAAMNRVVRVLAEIERIALSNRLLALNAKIQAVHVGELGAGFGVVAEEISEQARRSNELTEEITGVVKALRDGMKHATDALSEIATLDRARSAESRVEVERALKALEQKNSGMRDSLRKSAQEGEKLAEDVSQAVMALQFQDRVSQRIQHVIEALEGMHQSLGGSSAGRWADEDHRTREVREKLAGRYTMECERAVDRPAGSESDHVNVELF